MMYNSLIIIDNDYVNESIDLIEVANRLAGAEKSVVSGLGINLINKDLKGFDSLICVDLPGIQLKDSRVLTDIIEEVQQTYDYDSIIVLATDFGRMVAPRVAMRLEVGLVADITAIDSNEKERRLIRPAFSGNMLASIVCESTPIMASVHPNVFHFAGTMEPVISQFAIEKLKPSSIEVLAVAKESVNFDIREADVIVAAGAGYHSAVAELEGIADKLNGAIAVSKPLVEQNRAPRASQVGQSGKTVSPNLYIALGIYGSMQHVEGLKNVKDIISVNTDEGAPMNYLANLVVIGDAVEFVDKLTAKLQE